MFNFNDLKQAKKDSQSNKIKSEDEYETLLEKSKNFVNNISEEVTAEEFQETINNLIKTSKMKPNEPDSYFYIGCLFYFTCNYEDALRYFQTVELINEEFPKLYNMIELTETQIKVENSGIEINEPINMEEAALVAKEYFDEEAEIVLKILEKDNK